MVTDKEVEEALDNRFDGIESFVIVEELLELEAKNAKLKQGIIDDKDAEVVLVPKELYDQLERRGNRLAYFIDLLKLPSLFSKLSSTEKEQVLKGK